MNKLNSAVAVIAALIFITSCSKEYSLENGVDPRAGWQFREEKNFLKGPFYEVYDTTKTGVGYVLMLVGTTYLASDTVLVAQINFPKGRIVPGTYSTTTAGNGFYCSDGKDSANPVFLYVAEARSEGANLTFVVEEYDPVTQMISISFSGTALNPSKAPVMIEKGRFYAKVR